MSVIEVNFTCYPGALDICAGLLGQTALADWQCAAMLHFWLCGATRCQTQGIAHGTSSDTCHISVKASKQIINNIW